MDISLISISHKNAPLEVRARFAFPVEAQEELMRQIRTPLSNNSYKPFISSTTDMPVYRCPCEYPDEVIESALEALTDSARDPAPVKESLYCKIHGVDNSLRFSNK